VRECGERTLLLPCSKDPHLRRDANSAWVLYDAAWVWIVVGQYLGREGHRCPVNYSSEIRIVVKSLFAVETLPPPICSLVRPLNSLDLFLGLCRIGLGEDPCTRTPGWLVPVSGPPWGLCAVAPWCAAGWKMGVGR
jgi:hypothetical protein